MKNKIIKEITKSIDSLGFPPIIIAIEKPKNKELEQHKCLLQLLLMIRKK